MINIITPCSRPENLSVIEQSINIPIEYYRWIIVLDMDTVPSCYLPSMAEIYLHRNSQSIVGHAQRNYALQKIRDGHIYFNDDDTTIHAELWINIKDCLDKHDFISFDQANKDGSLRLYGNRVMVNHIDSHNFMISAKLCKNIRFDIDKYNADGILPHSVLQNLLIHYTFQRYYRCIIN